MTARDFVVLEPDAAAVPAAAADTVRYLLDYWRGLWQRGRVPARTEIDPLDFPHLLPGVAVLDVVDDGLFRFRLAGESINARYGSLKGRRLDEILTGDILDQTLREHRQCVDRAAPIYVRNSEVTRSAHGDMQVFQRLLLPLSEDGVTVDAILVYTHFERG